MRSLNLLVEVTAVSSTNTGVGRWIQGFCGYLADRGIEFHTTSASGWTESVRGPLRVLLRIPVIRDFLYYAIGLPRICNGYRNVVLLDNIGRLASPLPGVNRPFYLIHDLIPLEMSGGFIAERVGWSAALTWPLSRRIYRWRLRRILFAPGARFGYISKATELSALTAFGEPARRGILVGPMMMRLGVEATSGSPEAKLPASVSHKYVLALGTGDPKKGLDSLLAAWRLACVSDQLQLVLFGSSWKGKGRRWIDRKVRELSLENVVHVGPVSDAALEALYRDAAAFVFPSYFEGLGLPPAEFCVEGDGQLIVRDIPALREIYGDVAHLFSSDDQLATLLRAVAADGLEPPVPPTSRRETLRARLDSNATFERLWQAIQGQGHP